MTFDEVCAPHFSFRIRPVDGKTFGFDENGAEQGGKLSSGTIYVQSVKTTYVRGEFELITKDDVIRVAAVNPADVNSLVSMVCSGNSYLCQLSDPAVDGSAELHLLLFSGDRIEMGNLEIGIDEMVLEALARLYPKRELSLSDAAKIMWNKCILEHGGSFYFFVVAGEAAKTYLEAKNATENPPDDPAGKEETPDQDDADAVFDEDDADESGETPEIVLRNFAILGSDIRFALAEKDKGFGQTIFLASKITTTRNHRADSALRLARGGLKFVDWTEAGERSRLPREQIGGLTGSAGSYLRTWDKYGNIEGELFLERARKVGAIRIREIETRKDGIYVQCGSLTDDQKEILPTLKELALCGERLPEYLTNEDLLFEEYVSGITQKEEDDKFFGKKNAEKEDPPISFNVSDFNSATGRLCFESKEANSNLQDKVWIIYPYTGEIAQIKRRMNARKRIQEGRAANPNLGLLIEEEGQLPPAQLPKRKIPALTSFVRQRIFPKNPPTPAQERAIEVALNTPDIALIQGPPGTGKTTVIAAIIERLNQECDKREGLSGRVLLTGFQHDAVENMISRIAVNGLPVPKFGHRPGEKNEEDNSMIENRLEDWCRQVTEELKKKNPQIAESLEEKSLHTLCDQYFQAPSLKMAIGLLEHALSLSDVSIGADLRTRLQNELNRLKAEQNNEQPDNPILGLIRCIRTKETSFCDDGPVRAEALLFKLGEDLDEEDRNLLQKASMWDRMDEVPPFLKELRNLKGKLLKLYTPAPVFRQEKVRDSVIGLMQETLESIRKNGLSVRDKKTAALAELLLELENDPNGIRKTLENYSYAFAATCQQSANWMMLERKGVQSDDGLVQEMQYDYVIVDEAARVSPRDLMIPMHMGKHIILVGDHRQLPQLIDEDIALRLEKENSEGDGEEDLDVSEYLKESFFEYLFTKRLEKLEKADGIQRRVTLDKQFRTHPLLGEFVSRNFYERYNKTEKFESPLPEKYFGHHLSGTNGKCAMWLDVSGGTMAKEGTSWTRPSEAKAICARLKKWFEEEDARTDNPKERLSFGVIAFYKAQVELITRLLKKELGAKFTVYEKENRLRIGTVDAFQGMEFDVVFLSLVRSKKKGFGFLRLYNRINVGMSRQKKLLVAVGDAAYFSTPDAKKEDNVPGLADFLELCRKKGVIEKI